MKPTGKHGKEQVNKSTSSALIQADTDAPTVFEQLDQELTQVLSAY